MTLETSLAALAVGHELRAPMPGRFVPTAMAGDRVQPRGVIGRLEVLGRSIAVCSPGLHGLVGREPGGVRFVGYGDVLVRLDVDLALGDAVAPAEPSAASAGGLVFSAPTSGRFYGRPTPDKPAFVGAGSELTLGTTICLLEVMKTFHRVTYGGAELPERARVREVLVAEGADVNAGDPLLALEAFPG